MADNNLTIRVQMVGGREVVVQNEAIAGSMQKVGKSEEFAAEKAFLLGEGMYSLRRYGFYAITALGLTGAEVLKLGFQFDNAKREGTDALTAITGSARVARLEMNQLVQITNRSGVGLGFLVNETRTMLAFGYSVQQTNQYLRAFSDFAGKKGLGQSGVSSLVSLFTRVSDTGVFTSRDARALQGLGIPANQALGRALGLTPQQLYLFTHGQLQVPSGAALPALAGYIQNYANRQPYGLSQLFQILKGDIGQSLGGAESPLFGFARRELTAAVTGYSRGGFQGALTGVDPSGTLLAFVIGVKNAGIVLEHTLAALWTAGRPLVLLFGGLAKVAGAITGNLTAMKLIIEPLIGLYILDRAQTAYKILSEKLLGSTATTTATNVARLGVAATGASAALEKMSVVGFGGGALAGAGGGLAGDAEAGAAGGLLGRTLGGAGGLARGLGKGAGIWALLNVATHHKPTSQYDGGLIGMIRGGNFVKDLEHGFGLGQAQTWKNALSELGIPGISYKAPGGSAAQALKQAVKEGMAGTTFHGTLMLPDRQKLADVVFQGRQDAQART